MEHKNRIAWISVPAFISTDRFIIPELSKHFDIEWYLISKESEKIDFKEQLESIGRENGFKVSIIRIHQRNTSLSTAKEYSYFLRSIKKQNYDLVYNVMIGIPYYMPLLKRIIGDKKVLVAIHNVHVPKGGSMYLPSILYTKYTISHFKYFQTFSKSQKDELLRWSRNKICNNVNFVLMDYGKPTIQRDDSLITFLSFGIIRDYKRIDVLIQAAEEAYEESGVAFKVIIAGGCDDWEKYQVLIKHSKLFDLRLRRIEDSEVPNLFAESHYFVAPYQDIAQSGSAIIALNYNVPIIASKLEAFETYVEERKTGYLIRPANKNDLKNVICRILINHNIEYEKLRNNIESVKYSQFSTEAVSQLYISNFYQVIDMNKR